MEEFLRFPCPLCGKSVKARPDQAGKRVRCPGRGCGQVIQVPRPLSAEPRPGRAPVPIPASPGLGRGPRVLWPWIAGGATALLAAVALALGVWFLSRPPKHKPSPTDVASAPPSASLPAKEKDGEEGKVKSIQEPNQALPGKKGPRLVYAEGRDTSIGIVDVYVDTSVPIKGKPAQLLTSFPSGTPSLNLMIEFAANPPRQIEVKYEIQSTKSKVDTTPKGKGPVATSMYIDYNRTACLFAVPSDGVFADGPYQATVIINGKEYARLHWSVGE